MPTTCCGLRPGSCPVAVLFVTALNVLIVHFASPQGLVVPVIRNVENMNFADIERAIYELGEKVSEAGGGFGEGWEEGKELRVLDRHELIQSLCGVISDL